MNNRPDLEKKSIFARCFGKINWSSPPWLCALQRNIKARPKSFGASMLVILAMLIAGGYGYQWYKNLPKPRLVTAVITSPKITPIAETMIPDNLAIDFGINEGEFTPQSVAPMQAIDKEVTAGIEMTPKIAGTWLWESGSRLVFTPTEEWAAGQTYNITFAKEFFSSSSKMESYTWSFSTKPFEASISEFQLYQDPVNAKVRQAIATIQFNYPVDTKSLEKNVSLLLQEYKDDKTKVGAETYQFTVTYDEHKRVAYIHSESLAIQNVPRYLLLTVNKGVKSESKTAETRDTITSNLFIPDVGSYFKVASATASIIRNEQDKPEQILNVETSLGVTERDINKSLHMYLLPQDKPATKFEKKVENYDWQNPGEVTSLVQLQSSPVTLKGIPSDRNFATLHSYKFSAPASRYVFIKIDKGTRAFGDFVLTNDYVAIIKAPEFPKEIGFLHKGALLALSSEKKISVLVRGVPAVKFQIARVLPDNLNQLITQTEGDFNNPLFINQSFNEQNISEIFSEIQQFDTRDSGQQQYTALDLEKYLARQTNAQGFEGLFLLQATGWDVTNNTALDVKTSRMILITDLGLIVKDNSDGTHDVFVQSIVQGAPVANTEVSILGKNGLPILTRITDMQGRVSFPTLKDYVEAQEPVVYVARFGTDISFIPYNKSNRQLNVSKFDIGGIYNNHMLGSLSAFIFSDRGIYRPGDMAHIGTIVKQAYAQSQAAGMPLQMTITDPRGTTLFDKRFTLDETGFSSFDFQTNEVSPTGQYSVTLYTVRDEHTENFLGSTTFRVAEFQPDRLRIVSKLSEGPSEGWISPTGLTANISLWNLYGAPAAERRVSGKIVLTPESVTFDKYPDYIFSDPLVDPDKPPKVFMDTLTDVQTNEQGEAVINLNLDRFEKATYHLQFYAEGFEAESGRSVVAQSSALVSPLLSLVGYKPDGDLSYIKQNTQRNLAFIAVNPQLKQLAITDLRAQLISLHPVTTLVKKDNGTYQYQSIVQSTVISTKPFSIDESGVNYPLPTGDIGEFALVILDNTNTELSRAKFSIVGASQLPLAKNAELTVKLNKSEYKAGEDIELQITSPYTGAGLITIERDKVYSTQWFKTDTTNSVQTIHIPNDFQGNGYVNVAFVRGWDSPEIFISPLSYNIIPFTINNDNHAINIELDTPKLARPGETFNMTYKTDKPGKIIVYAVDEGILQVAKYQTPDPLAFFFQKHALEVLTQQTLDQILPQYIRDRELSSVGGDGGDDLLSNHLNPFKRKTDLPVVYWSGIIDTDSSPHALSWPIPDYFNGTVRVMAVAVSNDSVGSAEKKSEIRGDFIINPNVPTFVAPGDEFEITASIANNVKDSGNDNNVAVELTASPELEVIGSTKTSLAINEGQEKTVRYKVRATSTLGSAKLTFVASLANKSSAMNATLSVRPASVFSTAVSSGVTPNASFTIPVTRAMYTEYRNVDIVASSSPLILVTGLQRYLDNFPYGCTEQLVSKAMPLLAMTNQPAFTSGKDTINDKVASTIQLLSQRQMSSGGFSYWPHAYDNENNAFASVYAMQFLTEARSLNYVVPNDLMYAGIGYLKELASQNPKNMDSARIQAYAIYVLTRNELITTSYLTNLQLYLEKYQTDVWKKDIAGAYIASTYQLLKSHAEAQRLIEQYQPGARTSVSSDFNDANIADAQYLYLLARHFPEKLPSKGNKLVMSLVKAINKDDINTILSSYTSMALAAYTETEGSSKNTSISITENLADGTRKELSSTNSSYEKASVDIGVKDIVITNSDKQTIFYQLIQAGFDKKPDTDAIKQGMEIFREYRSSDKKAIESAIIGDEIEVHIRVRALGEQYLSNVALVDLLPGGFDVVRDSVKSENMDYTDVREDRVVFFLSISPEGNEIIYRIKAVSTGTFITPPIFAESMYDPSVMAQGVASTIVVTGK